IISLILKCYYSILLSVGVASVLAFITGLYVIFRKPASRHKHASPLSNKAPTSVIDNDLSAIAGEDVMSTQLDLARAYIETDKKTLAVKILKSVIAEGTAAQQTEAQHLLSQL